ncbi:hypothetical protein M407DRAFT_20215 [Tulasnella calospora MUT 4182]|uniref:Uncharacterized protein n=1 Tax=Tulasnella calospora MUT 4182 TaxID=1051891 RepID=A0A0C3QGD3_9AGAM|nr:hypothetical protein M407DRAFT_20215 [Tulasnella calospora MUT 4182]
MSRAIWCVLCFVAWLGLCSAQLPNVAVNFSCHGGYEWMLNSHKEDLCRVYAYLSAQSRCFSDKTWTVKQLDDDHKRYPPPNDDKATPCQCNEPVYSLIQACTVCQGFPANTSWSDWTDACDHTYQGFPYGLSPLIEVPAWANLDVIQADKWSEAVAKTYAETQNPGPSTGTSTGIPSPSGTHPDYNKVIKIIIGSSVGIGCLLIIVAVIIICRLRNRPRLPPPGDARNPARMGP